MIYLFFTNLSKERLMKCWDDIKKGSLMTLPNELKVFLTKEKGICSCANALPLGTPPSSPVKTCVVLLSVTEHLSPDYQLPVDMSPHLGGTHPLMTAQEWIPVHQAPSEWCPSFTADFNPGPVIPHCQGNPSLCHQIW